MLLLDVHHPPFRLNSDQTAVLAVHGHAADDRGVADRGVRPNRQEQPEQVRDIRVVTLGQPHGSLQHAALDGGGGREVCVDAQRPEDVLIVREKDVDAVDTDTCGICEPKPHTPAPTPIGPAPLEDYTTTTVQLVIPGCFDVGLVANAPPSSGLVRRYRQLPHRRAGLIVLGGDRLDLTPANVLDGENVV